MKGLEGKNVRTVKKIFVAITGFTVLIMGIAMIVLPGPAIIVIPLGLALSLAAIAGKMACAGG